MSEAKEILDAILSSITRSLLNNQRVELRGFGTFQVRERAARKGRNPKSGAQVLVAPRRVAGFKPAQDLLKIINGTPINGSRFYGKLPGAGK